jgi:hypothetical protein
MRFTLSILSLALGALSFGCSSSSTSTNGTDAGTTENDGGGSGSSGTVADGFVGTWTRTGNVSVICGDQAPTMTKLTGNLVIALGTGANAIVATTPDGCMTKYTITGSVASEDSGQTCMSTNGKIENTQHTLTLSGDRKSLSETSQGTILEPDPDGGMMNCTLESMGTFSKQ